MANLQTARSARCKARWRAAGRCVVCGAKAGINESKGAPYSKCAKHRLLEAKRSAARKAERNTKT